MDPDTRLHEIEDEECPLAIELHRHILLDDVIVLIESVTLRFIDGKWHVSETVSHFYEA